MIPLSMGDHVYIDGKEFEVWSVSVGFYPDGMTGKIDLVDPLQAVRWREDNKAKKAQTDLTNSGVAVRVLDKVEKTLEEAS